MRETIYNNVKECTIHRPTNIIAMIKIFGAKSVLDMSAGWGDRLIGAMAADVEYVGVDPNKCLHPGYQEIIKFFNKSPKKYLLIEDKFEEVDLPERNYDLVYSSPPYFDLEIYTSESPQSSEYTKEEEWFEHFLKPSLLKAWNALITNGIMAININQKKGETYIQKMLNLVNGYNNSVYLGVISYADKKLYNPQPIWIWRKVDKQFFRQKYKKYIKRLKMV